MTTYAFCLGVNQYRAPIDPLKCAEKDARDLAALLKHKLGFEAEYLEERYTEAIEDRIAALEGRLKPGDSFLFYFSGHGKAHGDDQYFLLSGCRYEQLEAGATVTGGVLSWQSLKQLTTRPPWRGVHRIFIIDACRTLLIAGKGAGEHPAFDGRVLLRDPAGAGNARAGETDVPLTLINACGEGQCAVEIPERGNSLFNSALMNRLTDAADRGEDVVLDADFVAGLAAPISELGRAHGYHGIAQEPIFRGSPTKLRGPSVEPATDIAAAAPVRLSLDQREWLLAQSEDTVASYEHYVRQAPEGLHIPEALALIKAMGSSRPEKAESEAYERVKVLSLTPITESTKQHAEAVAKAAREYLAAYPEGRWVAEVKSWCAGAERRLNGLGGNGTNALKVVAALVAAVVIGVVIQQGGRNKEETKDVSAFAPAPRPESVQTSQPAQNMQSATEAKVKELARRPAMKWDGRAQLFIESELGAKSISIIERFMKMHQNFSEGDAIEVTEAWNYSQSVVCIRFNYYTTFLEIGRTLRYNKDTDQASVGVDCKDV